MWKLRNRQIQNNGVKFRTSLIRKTLQINVSELKDWGACPDKQNIRNNVIKAIKRAKSTGSVLTLSGYQCNLEKQLHKAVPHIKFTSCERIANDFKALAITIKKEKLKYITTIFNDIKNEIFNSKKDSWAHLFLDYCGKLSTHKEEIIFAINNDIVKKNGVIFITLSNRLHGSHVGEKLTSIINEHGKGKYKIHKQTKNYSHEKFSYIEYKNPISSPVMAMIIRRIN